MIGFYFLKTAWQQTHCIPCCAWVSLPLLACPRPCLQTGKGNNGRQVMCSKLVNCAPEVNMMTDKRSSNSGLQQSQLGVRQLEKRTSALRVQ